MKTLLIIVVLAISCPAQTLDKKFWAVSAFSATALGLDAYTSSWINPHHADCRTEGGEPWLLGTEPTDKRLIAVGFGEFALGESLMYFTKRTHNRWIHPLWPAWGLLRGGVHIYAVVNNFEVCR